MKPFLGLFAHWDVVSRQEPPAFLRRYFADKKDAEYHITKGLQRKMSSSLQTPEKRIGGNAGNAAVALSELGIPSVLSCPVRAGPFMKELGKYRISLMAGGKEASPLRCARDDEDPEHIVLEREGYRKIFNYDHVQKRFLLDAEFWESLNNASYLFLSGFHNVSEKHKKKVGEIADYLEGRKFKVHLELGSGEKSLIRHAMKRLIERGCIDSLGMADTDTTVFQIKAEEPAEKAQDMLSLVQSNGLERMSLHAREYRLTAFMHNPEANLKAAELSIQACAAKALGGIGENFKAARSVPFSGIKPHKSSNYLLMPTRIVQNPKIIVGMGDTAAVTDSFFAMKS